MVNVYKEKIMSKANKTPVEDSDGKVRGEPIRLVLPPEVHHLVRRAAAERKQSMSAFAREVVEREARQVMGINK